MKLLTRLSAFFFLLACILPVHALTVEDIPNVHVADRTRYMSDMAGAMSAQARAHADSTLASIWREASAEPVVVIVPDLEGEDIDDFATRLFSAWGIGKGDKDNGVLVLISTGDRKAVIRTGYGAEGVLPDVIASNIIRHDMAPHFRTGDYDGGVLAALSTMHKAMTSDEAREELMSAQQSDAADEDDDFFEFYIGICAVAGVVALVLVLGIYFSERRRPTSSRYSSLDGIRLAMLMASFLTLGCVFPAYIVMVLLMRHVRMHKRLCPNCSTRMERVDEDNDNAYLTPSQDAEERLDSVDYDVWLCPSCGETDIIPYVNPKKNYTVCPSCHARACVLTNDRMIIRPTTTREGRGVKDYTCLNCKKRFEKPYVIAKEAVPPVVIIPGGGHGGFGGGGGFSGGSFGGGMTGGGGASGGW